MLQGKSAIVTGSTSGIGQGIAERLARAGCNVMLNGFGDADAIEQLRSGLEREHGVQARYSGADMTRPAEIAQLIEDTAQAFGGIDVLVNNAGIQHVAPVDEFPLDKWDAIIAINMSSSFHTIRAALSHMKARGWGRIVNIASAHALRASPFKAAYVTAKHGVLGLTKTVALEVAEQNITCNAICPGYVHTPLVDNQIEDTAKARGIGRDEVIRDVILYAQPTKQFVTVEQISEMVVFLCGEAGASITGTALSMDGGWTAK